MVASVPLPFPFGGDPEILPRNRQNPIPEPRNPQISVLETFHYQYNQPSNQIHVNFYSRVDGITHMSGNLIRRLQILKHRLVLLRRKPKRILDEIYKKPPDPDPTVSTCNTKEVVIDALDGLEESPAMMQDVRVELQEIIESNLENEEASYMSREGCIKGAECDEISHSTIIHQAIHFTLGPRCSTICPMESASDHGLPAIAVKPHHADDAMVSHAEESRRAGKEVGESSKHGEKSVLVVNMSGAREALRPRFLGVGLFLSVLLVTSRQLIDHMKRVWKIRGDLEASEIESEAGRKFILDFSEEGDWRHAIVGGPWQYKGDAFLVEGIAAGADPLSALFTHVPMWVQFRNIPYYLLTKKLAHDLGECIGTTMKIDANARGNIDDKFIRTRVQLPLYKALQSEIQLVDEITEEEVIVQLRYERLPNFCLFCGFIGHMEARCDMPREGRKINFNLNLRVRPIHFEDPRSWFLPNVMGRPRRHTPTMQLWRAPEPVDKGNSVTNSVLGVFELVQEKVASLSVIDKNPIVTGKSDNNADGMSATGKEKENVQGGDERVKSDDMQAGDNSTRKKWKRKVRDDLSGQSKVGNSEAPPHNSEVVRANEGNQNEEMGWEPAAKKPFCQEITLSDGVGKLGEEDNSVRIVVNDVKDSGKDVLDGSGGEAATGLGATGTLSDANGSVRQEP